MSLAVKICGVTRPDDAAAAVELGASLIGVNFWPRSPRFVESVLASEIVDAVSGRVPVVGVFVDPTEHEIARAVVTGIDRLQFHGDETPELVADWSDRAIQVFRVADAFDPAELDRYPTAGAYLFDVRHEAYGGTGRSWPYHLVRDLPTTRPVWVAGGVRPGTVTAVVAACDPHGIDVCSGVESAPGVKDLDTMNALFEEVRDGEVSRPG